VDVRFDQVGAEARAIEERVVASDAWEIAIVAALEGGLEGLEDERSHEDDTSSCTSVTCQ